MATIVQTVAIHATGEDNEGNFALAARTREALEAKVLAWHNEAFAEDPHLCYTTFQDLLESDTYALGFGESTLED